MKKIYFTFLVFILTGISWLVFWYPIAIAAEDCSWQCKISDGPAPAILEYIQNTNKVISLVRSQPRPPSRGGDYWVTVRGANRNVIWAFNSLFNWNSYYSSFDYYVTLPISQNVPPQIKRDIQLLENHIKMLSRLLESTVRKWNTDKIVNVCSGLESYNCKLDNTEGKVILIALIRNSENILNYIRLSIQWKWDEHTGNFILVKDNFQQELDIYYNSYTLESCGKCQWNFSETVQTSMTSITDYNKLWKNGIQRWKDAWNLLIWNVSEAKYREIERQVLSRELSRQWLRGEQSEIIMGNLERYNGNGFSLSNNYVANSFAPAARSLGKVVDEFSLAMEKAYERYGWNPVPFVELITVEEEVKKSTILEKEILAFYETHRPLANIQDVSAETLLWRIRDYHLSLSAIIKQLSDIVSVSEAVCDSQARWLWQCKYR